MTNTNDEALLTTTQAARRLGITVERLYRLAARGIVPRVVMGRLVRFSPRALDDFVACGGRGPHTAIPLVSIACDGRAAEP